MRTAVVGLAAALFVVVPRLAWPCTTFCLEGKAGAVIGKSYDWEFGDARLFVNKAGVAKQAIVFEGTPQPWVSKHSSLTFNQFGREFPNGGINEAGLVVEVMMLSGTVHPKPDKRKAINELQWIQYQLDMYDSVKDVLANADAIRVSPISSTGKLHYLVCDKGGTCAALEYIDGQLKRSAGKDLPVPVLTNDTYEKSKTHLADHTGFGGEKAVPKDGSSLSRFVIAAAATQKKTIDPIATAFSTLDKVRQGDYTKWNIVYDTGNMKVHFRSLGHNSVKVVDLKTFFAKDQVSCKVPVKTLDMNVDADGDVTNEFKEYIAADNLRLVQTTLGRIPNFPQSVIAMAAAYPASLPCGVK